MKVENERKAPVDKPRADFKQALKVVAAKPALAPVKPKLTQGAAGAAPLALAFHEARAHAHQVAEARSRARAVMEVKVEQAHEARSDGVSQNDQKLEAKALDLIGRELKDDKGEASRDSELKPAQVIHFQPPRAHGAGGPVAKTDSKDAKVGGILELVEKIRVFERQGRPAMALTVGGSLDAHVEIERAGHRLVTLKVVGKAKVPSAARLNEIREELGRRGIKVASLSISAA